jgi:hypothetical protein
MSIGPFKDRQEYEACRFKAGLRDKDVKESDASISFRVQSAIQGQLSVTESVRLKKWSPSTPVDCYLKSSNELDPGRN